MYIVITKKIRGHYSELKKYMGAVTLKYQQTAVPYAHGTAVIKPHNSV